MFEEHAFLVTFHVVLVLEVVPTNAPVVTLILIVSKVETSAFVLQAFGMILNLILLIVSLAIQIVVHAQALRTTNASLVVQEESEMLTTIVSVRTILFLTQVGRAIALGLLLFPKESVFKAKKIHVARMK